MKMQLVAVAALSFLLGGAAYANSPEKDSALVGKPVPAFDTTDVAGEKIASAKLAQEGRPALINFWGLRCSACLEEMVHLNALFEKYGGNVRFLGVNVDSIDGALLAAQIKKMNIDIRYTVIPDPEFKMVDTFKMMAAPYTVIVDGQGVVRFQHENYAPGDEKLIEDNISKLIKK